MTAAEKRLIAEEIERGCTLEELFSLIEAIIAWRGMRRVDAKAK